MTWEVVRWAWRPEAFVRDVSMSAQGRPAPDIAHLMVVTEGYVRDVIHAFNEQGFDALDFTARMRRILDLYDHAPNDCSSVCAPSSEGAGPSRSYGHRLSLGMAS